MAEDNSLIAFKAICNFISDVSAEIGAKYRKLRLYNKLISKTKISHDAAIHRHIELFRSFFFLNKESILERDASKICSPLISYSKNVEIDMNNIFELCDDDSKNVVWQHLLTILAILDPSCGAKKALKDVPKQEEGDESDFLNSMISKVEQKISPTSTNPMEMVSSLMSSGLLTELMSGMSGGVSSGKLNMDKLMGSITNMVGDLEKQAGDDPMAKQAFGMINSMTMMMKGGAKPDLTAMMSMMTSSMASMSTSAAVEEVSTKEDSNEPNNKE